MPALSSTVKNLVLVFQIDSHDHLIALNFDQQKQADTGESVSSTSSAPTSAPPAPPPKKEVLPTRGMHFAAVNPMKVEITDAALGASAPSTQQPLVAAAAEPSPPLEQKASGPDPYLAASVAAGVPVLVTILSSYFSWFEKVVLQCAVS